MRRADNLYVQAIRVMPPVIKRSRGEYGEASPAGEKDAQRGAQSKNNDRRRRHLGVPKKSALYHQPGADDGGYHGAELDGQMRWSPERIAADGAVPGDIPRAPDSGRR